MSYRRSKAVATDANKWRDFLERHRDLVITSGLPSSVISTREIFEDLLMHGYLDHHEDPSSFAVSKLEADQFHSFRELVFLYFAEGYLNPGLMALPHKDRMALARMYPDQFNY